MRENRDAILMLTGDPQLNEQVQRLSSDHEQLVLHVDSSLRAILKIISYDFSLLIVDFDLANLCFDDLIRIVKKLDSDLPILVTIDNITKESLARLIECDVVDYIVRSAEPLTRERIMELINKKKLKKALQIDPEEYAKDMKDGTKVKMSTGHKGKDVVMPKVFNVDLQGVNNVHTSEKLLNGVHKESCVEEESDNFEKKEEQFFKDLFDERDFSFKETAASMPEVSHSY
ncbi:MAG: hypothetical protein V2J62_02920 [candidate division KSB1 bacterium]|jgi:DNA-binding NarL/FixJ family response regulator|nr:hypothetical protein [candidate division KSB1 bacterium]